MSSSCIDNPVQMGSPTHTPPPLPPSDCNEHVSVLTTLPSNYPIHKTIIPTKSERRHLFVPLPSSSPTSSSIEQSKSTIMFNPPSSTPNVGQRAQDHNQTSATDVKITTENPTINQTASSSNSFNYDEYVPPVLDSQISQHYFQKFLVRPSYLQQRKLNDSDKKKNYPDDTFAPIVRKSRFGRPGSLFKPNRRGGSKRSNSSCDEFILPRLLPIHESFRPATTSQLLRSRIDIRKLYEKFWTSSSEGKNM